MTSRSAHYTMQTWNVLFSAPAINVWEDRGRAVEFCSSEAVKQEQTVKQMLHKNNVYFFIIT